MLIGIMKAWREKLAHEQMAKISGTWAQYAYREEGKKNGELFFLCWLLRCSVCGRR